MNDSGNLSEATYQWLDDNPYAGHERDTVKASLDQTTDLAFNAMKSIDALLLEKLQKISDMIKEEGFIFDFEQIDQRGPKDLDLDMTDEEKTDIKRWIINHDDKALLLMIKEFGLLADNETESYLIVNHNYIENLLFSISEIINKQ